jgi:acyl-CoA thioester hydrolase
VSAVDPLVYTARWRVRSYEIDQNGHVNNAVYLNYAEALTVEHAEAAGYGRAWTEAHGGAWVVRRHEVEYLRAARMGDLLDLTVQVELVRGVRGLRLTTIRNALDGAAVAEVRSEWVWVRLSDGRPARVPAELVELAAEVTEVTLARQRAGRRAAERNDGVTSSRTIDGKPIVQGGPSLPVPETVPPGSHGENQQKERR